MLYSRYLLVIHFKYSSVYMQEKEMATCSSILAWEIPWTEEPSGLHTVHKVAESRTQLVMCTHTCSKSERIS